MKRVCLLLVLAMTGCATVGDLQSTPATLSVISGKNPQEYTNCFVARIAETRKPPQVQPREDNHEGFIVIVPQKLNSAEPAAVLNVESRSGGGSSIKLYERLANLPLRLKDVQHAAQGCISGD